jgi:hypothetical protein
MNLTGMQFITLVPAAFQLEHEAPEVSAAQNSLGSRSLNVRVCTLREIEGRYVNLLAAYLGHEVT